MKPKNWHDAAISMRSQGMSYKSIAQKLNVGRSTVNDYINSLKVKYATQSEEKPSLWAATEPLETFKSATDRNVPLTDIKSFLDSFEPVIDITFETLVSRVEQTLDNTRIEIIKDESSLLLNNEDYDEIAFDNFVSSSRESVNATANVSFDVVREVGLNKTKGVTHLVIPDSQVRPDVDLSYLKWIGEYIVKKKPDVIIHLGDFADLPSLGSYDKGKKSAEGRRLNEDIASVKVGLKLLLNPLRNLQKQQREQGVKVYEPRLVITLGNHCDRLTRHINANAELDGFLSMKDLGFEEAGFEVHPFLTPVVIDGISYCHYFPQVMTGKALSGTALNMLKTLGTSFTMGHRQTLDVTTRFLQTTGDQQWGLICGACYLQDEEYKTVQGNRHFRGIIVKHNVKEGSYDPMFVSLNWLKSEYE
jgi:hypothetical protein